jgi:hypothetical protein
MTHRSDMTTVRLPPFLRALELGNEADERAVRRAYAQRLRRIDPELDPDGFQTLREHYENALRWVQVRREEIVDIVVDEAAGRVSDEVLVEAAAPAEVDEGTRMQAVGEEVYAGFARLAMDGFADEAAARRALTVALDDERLVNLEARTFFEWRVACLLMEGWRPGNEFLFGPACKVFNWEDDRRRLSLFGHLGAALDAAITEKLIFFSQPPHEFDVQRDLIRRLREAKQPPPATLVEQAPRLQVLVQRYPHWLRIVTSQQNITQWQAWRGELPAAAVAAAATQPKARPAPSRYEKTGSGLPWWPFAILIYLVIKGLSFLGHSAEEQAFRPSTTSRPSTQWGAPPPSLVLPESRLALPVPSAPSPLATGAAVTASAPKPRVRETHKAMSPATDQTPMPVWLAMPAPASTPTAIAAAPVAPASSPARRAVPKPSPYSLSSGSKAVDDAVPDVTSGQRSTYELRREADPPVDLPRQTP